MIRAGDRVAAVLEQDESLIDVFTALSPAFERLRSTAMRRVMTRLVTVGQAARIAGVSEAELLLRLNEALSGRPTHTMLESSVHPEATTSPTKPDALRAIPEEKIVHLDVREDLRNGQEPFSRIMAARREVPADGALALRAIFEPVPLYAVLGKQGFTHWTEQLAADDWRVWFFAAVAAGETDPQPIAPTQPDDLEGDVHVLDVRGLEPPEPMLRTLAALESLPDGATLVQLNVRVPQFLLPQLHERGFTYEVREQEPGLVRLFIRRAAAG